MPIIFRETRLDEINDAVMFAMAGGQAMDADTVRHYLSHTASSNGEVVGSAVMCVEADAQQTVVVHVETPTGDDASVASDAVASDDAEEAADPGEASGADGDDAKDQATTQTAVNAAPSITTRAVTDASNLDDPAVLARRLLDLTLMKLLASGESTTRLRAEPGLAGQLLAEASWLDRLPDLAPPAEDDSWLEALGQCNPEAVDVVQRAWVKATKAMESLHGVVDGVAQDPSKNQAMQDKSDEPVAGTQATEVPMEQPTPITNEDAAAE